MLHRAQLLVLVLLPHLNPSSCWLSFELTNPKICIYGYPNVDDWAGLTELGLFLISFAESVFLQRTRTMARRTSPRSPSKDSNSLSTTAFTCRRKPSNSTQRRDQSRRSSNQKTSPTPKPIQKPIGKPSMLKDPTTIVRIHSEWRASSQFTSRRESWSWRLASSTDPKIHIGESPLVTNPTST